MTPVELIRELHRLREEWLNCYEETTRHVRKRNFEQCCSDNAFYVLRALSVLAAVEEEEAEHVAKRKMGFEKYPLTAYMLKRRAGEILAAEQKTT